MGERYIHHPNFGLLYVVCPTPDPYRSLFTTLYAHRLFFIVMERTGEPISYEPISRAESRQVVEERIRILRRLREPSLQDEQNRLETFYKQTFI